MNFEEFKNSLSEIPVHQIVFVGLGNRYREEDTAGLLFLGNLEKQRLFRNSHFINAETNPENHLQEIIDLNPSLIIFIDTVEKENSCSDIFWLDSNIIDEIDFSTHAYSIKLVEKYIMMYINTTVRYLGIAVEPLAEYKGIASERFQFIAEFFNEKQAENA